MSNAIRIAILANGSQARSEMSKTAAAAEGIGAKFTKLRLPAAVALGGIALGAKQAINAASDLNEEISKSQQIFGKNAAAINKFASNADTKLGQSKRQALEAAGTFGLIGQKAGLSGTETAKFATQFTGLASDLASFNNTSPDEAITAIGAAMRGESEPIRKYGVLLDDATLRARALKLGLIDNIKQALTPQKKALAASQEILAQTTKAQGDFARTADGAANKSRILAAQQENVKAKLGKGLLPAYQAVLSIMSKFATFASEHTTLVKGIVIAIGALAVVVLAASAAQKVYTAGLLIYNVTAKAVTIATKAWQIAQVSLNVAMALNPIGVVVIAVLALVAVIVLAYKKSTIFRNIVNGAFTAVKNVVTGTVSTIVGFVKSHWPLLLAILAGPFGLAVLAIIKHRDKILDVVRGLKDKIVGIFTGAKDWLLHAGEAIIQGLLDGIGNMIGKLKDKLGSITNLIPKLKGPPSRDRRLLYDNGRLIIGGLIAGIEREIPGVRRTLAALTGDISGFDANLGGNVRLSATGALAAAAAGSGSTTVQINVKVDPTANPAETGRAVVDAVRAYYGAGGAKL